MEWICKIPFDMCSELSFFCLSAEQYFQSFLTLIIGRNGMVLQLGIKIPENEGESGKAISQQLMGAVSAVIKTKWNYKEERTLILISRKRLISSNHILANLHISYAWSQQLFAQKSPKEVHFDSRIHFGFELLIFFFFSDKTEFLEPWFLLQNEVAPCGTVVSNVPALVMVT